VSATGTDWPNAWLRAALDYEPRDPSLFVAALTHRSASGRNNERLEFLGDSVIAFSVCTSLFEARPDLLEGDLTRVRAHLVRQDSLHALALGLGLPSLIRLGEGEARSGGSQRPSILADALEAVIGAVYLDAGYDTAQALVRHLFSAVDITPGMLAAAKDPKTELQEWLQGRRMKLPAYRVVGTLGAAHKQTFDVECAIAELGAMERGIGASRRAAEQAAAAAMLLALKTRNS